MEYMPKDKTAVPPPTEYLPQHIGIIMDGNGRWAKARGLAREYGHRRGLKSGGQPVEEAMPWPRFSA